MQSVSRQPFPNDPYLRHYFRLAKLYCGPSIPAETMKRHGIERRVDESGVRATVKLREIFRNEPKPGQIEVLAFLGKRWESGFSTFEDRVAAITATYTEGALLARQAA